MSQQPLHQADNAIWPIAGLVFVVVMAMWAPNVLDPLMQWDDYPAFFGDADQFWPKTLEEGRWVNYLWHLRGVQTPAWFNFAAYQLVWAIFCAATAVAVTGKGGWTGSTVILALFIAVAPPAMTFSFWFNASIPGLALLAIFAVLACRMSSATLRALLPIFIIVSFVAYTMHPIILLTLCLVRTENRSFLDLVKLLTVCLFSLIAALLIVYTLNWLVHGFFGIPPSDWRIATPAHDVAGLIANLSKLTETFELLFLRFSFYIVPLGIVHLTLLAWATITMLRFSPLETLYLYAGLCTGIAVCVAQVLKLGLIVPPRAFLFAWVIYTVIVVRAIMLQGLAGAVLARAAHVPVLLVTAVCFIVGFNRATYVADWQTQTRDMAQTIAAQPEPIFYAGGILNSRIGQWANVQSEESLVYRIRDLTGHDILPCDDTAPTCNSVQPAGDVLAESEDWRIITLDSDRGTLILFNN